MCAGSSDFTEILNQLKNYVDYRHRRGHANFDLGEALIAHRAQCMQNLLDEEDRAWQRRIEVLDAIAQAHGISLEGEDSLRNVLQILSERERLRRSEEVARHR